MRIATMLSSAVLTVAGVGLFAPPALAATEITCGATLTGDLYLSHDLTCDEGINLTGDATLDLGGHRFSGPQRGADGITVNGVGAFQILNGRLSNWSVAVAPGDSSTADPDEGAGSLLVDQVTVADNSTGLSSQGSSLYNPDSARQVTVQRSRFARNSTAVTISSARITVRTSTFADNSTAANTSFASDLSIQDSVLVRNQRAVDCDESGCELNNATLRDNPTGINGSYGAYIGLTNSSVTGSTVGVRSGNVIHTGGGGDLTGNRFADNTSAVEINTGGELTVTGNTFTRNDSAVTSDATGTDDDAQATLINNTLTRNGDAINLLIPVRLQGNSAVNNTGWGIYAPNATDLGANTAHGNGKSPQCTGVVCS